MGIKEKIVVYGTAAALGLGAILGVEALRPQPQLPTFEEWRQEEIAKRRGAIAVIDYLITDKKLRGLKSELASVNTQIQILKTQESIYKLQDALKNLPATTGNYQEARH